jgi:hypothetical protein
MEAGAMWAGQPYPPPRLFTPWWPQPFPRVLPVCRSLLYCLFCCWLCPRGKPSVKVCGSPTAPWSIVSVVTVLTAVRVPVLPPL